MVANIRGYTPNYSFKLINFDTPRWHTLEYANWQQLDALLRQSGIPGVRGEWLNSTRYFIGDRAFDGSTGVLYRCLVEHDSAPSGTFAADRAAHPSYWTIQSLGVPIYRGTWLAGATYTLGDIVVVDTYAYYLCTTDHHSSTTFPPDAPKWTLVFDATAAVNTTNASATAAAGSASAASTSATNAAASATNANNSAIAAADSANKLFGTSTSSTSVGLGGRTFETQTGKYFNVGKFIMVRANANPVNEWMWGQVTSYSATTLVMNSLAFGGVGSFADWIIDVSGSRGAIGPQGIQGEVGPGLIIKGTVPNAGALPPTGNTIGDAYVATDNNHLYVWDGTQWDDAGPLGNSTTTTADTAPAGANDGDMWLETDTGIFWIMYDDGNTKQWVQAGGVAGLVTQNAVLRAGDTMTGDLVVSKPQAAVVLNAVGASQSLVTLKQDGSNRWSLYKATATHNFGIARFNNAGAFVDDPLLIDFATGDVNIAGNFTFKGVPAAPLDALAYNGMQINGSFDVNQEKGHGAFITNNGGTICDGWKLFFSGTMAMHATSWSNPNVFVAYQNYLVSAPTTAQAVLGSSDYVLLTHYIEGYRTARLAWGFGGSRSITICFWTAHSKPGIYSVSIRNAAFNRVYVATYTQVSSNVSQFNTIVVPGDTTGTWAIDNTVGISITFTQAAGSALIAPSANTWMAGSYVAAPGQVNAADATTSGMNLGGVVIVPGTQAPTAAQSPLIMRPYDQELVTCKRYFEAVGEGFVGQWANTTTAQLFGKYITKRAIPTLTKRASGVCYIEVSNLGWTAQDISTVSMVNSDNTAECMRVTLGTLTTNTVPTVNTVAGLRSNVFFVDARL